jgi:hypothetical protein
MPLIATSRPPAPVKLGVGCWMAVRGMSRAELIWVVATREALVQLDPSGLPDKHVLVFENHRAKIQDAASAKFDSEGLDPDDGEHEGRPILMVRRTTLILDAPPTLRIARPC